MAKKKHYGNGPERAQDPKGEGDAIPEVYLLPGQIIVAPNPCSVRTILGSCVAVCVWNSTLGIGGMSHFVLPFQAAAPQLRPSPRFGNVAIPMLIERLVELGSKRRDLSAKLFGGASVLSDAAAAAQRPWRSVGLRNIEIAHKLLFQARIQILAKDLGGSKGRKVIFQVHNGAAWVRAI